MAARPDEPLPFCRSRCEGSAGSPSGDGRYVAFISQDHGLDGSNDNNFFDVFVRFTTRPLVKTVAPATVARGSTATLTLTGTGFFTNTRVAFSGQGVQVTNIVFVNPKTLNVTVSVAANATRSAPRSREDSWKRARLDSGLGGRPVYGLPEDHVT